jgi:RNA polymerase sigma-70 factor (ECF subfamily)
MAVEPRVKPVSCEPSSNGQPLHALAVAVRNGDAPAADAGRATSIGLAGAEADCDLLRTAMERFEGRLVRYAMRITGHVERGRDVVQETFLRQWRDPAIAKSDHLAQWLFTVCRRLSIDARRKESRMSTQLENTAVCDVPARTVSATMEQSDQLDHLLRLLGGLPANQQEVVRLKFQEEMSYKEIAAITGLSVSNVGYLMHTAVKTLRERVSGDA